MTVVTVTLVRMEDREYRVRSEIGNLGVWGCTALTANEKVKNEHEH